MALNDIYRIRLSTAYDAAGSVILQNVFYYKEVFNVPGNDDSTELAAQFKVVVFPRITDILHVDAHIAGMSVENIIPGPDNVFEIYGTTDFLGARTGDKMPPFVSFAFQYNRNSTDIRNGAKRFGPISETDQSAGAAIGAIIPLLNTLASQLGANLGTPGVTSVYQPRIFRPSSTGKTIPAKIIPAKLQADRDVASVDYVRVTTQNSRKFGEGS